MLTNITFGQLFQDNTYRIEMMKALEAEKVQTLTLRETCITQVLKVYIKLKGIFLSVLLDTEASVLTIFKDLAQKLQLKVEANDGIKVSPLGKNPKVKVIGLIREASLSVQYIRIPRTLYVVKGMETILILGTDQFNNIKQILGGLTIKSKLPIKEKRHDSTYYLRKIVIIQ